ncbi:hypothetical protein [Streptomyces goshikiensis]|uniref:hypothetical protein n=1 Tax=Streptomyces goshikiensis TaxID=1942 RepID=UPI003695BAFC
MAADPLPTTRATLYDTAYYQGTVATVRPDRGDEGEAAIVYSLAGLGLRRLGSLQAPAELTVPDNPFRHDVRAVTHVTVWSSRPVSSALAPGEQGTTWQQYTADTADLGIWSARTK